MTSFPNFGRLQTDEASPAAMLALEQLAARLHHEIEMVSYPTVDWVQPLQAPNGKPALDCLIVGGGQFGLALAFALRRERVTNILVLDQNESGQEGPWTTYARMETLRTPKTLTGPDLGLPSLTFRAWCDARFGEGMWDRLERIPREWWMAYLVWYRNALDIPVRNHCRVRAVRPETDTIFRIEIEGADEGAETETLFARTVIFATGAIGSGENAFAPVIEDNLPRQLYAHSNEPIDFAALKGKCIGILGAGASAFDNAATALETGAAEAHLFFRRPALPRDNPRRWMEFSGFLAHYPELSDAERWAYMSRLYDISQPPPSNTFARATRLPGFHLHPGSPWLEARTMADGRHIEVSTPKGCYQFDFVISATGIDVDMAKRPELSMIAPHVATWGQRYQRASGSGHERLARFPYLGRFGEFTEREAGAAPWAGRLFAIFRGATLSLGPSAASNSNMKYTVPRIVAGVTRQLFLDFRSQYYRAFIEDDHAELRAINA